jgi:hypothetical protein
MDQLARHEAVIGVGPRGHPSVTGFKQAVALRHESSVSRVPGPSEL